LINQGLDCCCNEGNISVESGHPIHFGIVCCYWGFFQRTICT
jgi:hypothetical protein